MDSLDTAGDCEADRLANRLLWNTRNAPLLEHHSKRDRSFDRKETVRWLFYDGLSEQLRRCLHSCFSNQHSTKLRYRMDALRKLSMVAFDRRREPRRRRSRHAAKL